MNASTILIVDDEKPIRQWFEYVIRQCAAEFECVGVCSNGKEALEMYERHKPDIVITDIRMPVMDGLELIRTIKERGGSAQFLILSNYDHFEYVKKGLVMGAKDYLLKAETADLEIIEALRRIRQSLAAGIMPASGSALIGDDEIATVLIRDYLRHLSVNDGLLQKMTDFLTGNALCPGYVWTCSLDGYWARVAEKREEETKAWFSGLAAGIRERLQQRGLSSAAIQTGENEYMFIVELKTEGTDAIASTLSSLGKEVNADLRLNFGCTLSIGFGSAFTTLEQMKAAYAKAGEALAQRFYSGPSGTHIYERFGHAEAARERCLLHIQQLLKGLQVPNKRLIPQVEQALDLIAAEGRNGLKPHDVITMVTNMLDMIHHKLTAMIEGPVNGALLYDPASLARESEFMATLRAWALNSLESILNAAEVQWFRYSEATNAIICYLYEHYSEKVNMAQLAQLVHLNENYISQLFKRETGQSVTRYLLSIRMERARELLLENKLKMHEIAAEVCYASESHFGSAFKLYFGKSPRNYIEHLRKPQ